MTSCIGGVLSVDCGCKGYYQGKLVAVDAATKNITLECVFRDGVPLGKSIVINGTDIVDLKVLRTSDNPTEPDEKPKTSETKKTKNELPQRNARNQPSKSVSDFMYSKNKYGANSISAENDSSSFSSDGELSTARRERSRNSKKKAYHIAHSDHEQTRPPEFTPTPHYKKFEPQVPRPQCLSGPSSSTKKKGKERGASPSGIPVVDFRNGYGRHYKKKSDLDRPLDFESLETDFDFDANLKLFDEEGNESDDREFFEHVEMAKASRNFAHYENIIADPNRITSWTGITSQNGYVDPPSEFTESLTFKVTNLESVSTGGFVPCLEQAEKKRFIKSCVSYLSQTVYHTLIADRLFQYSSSIIKRFSLVGNSVVILGDKDVSEKLIQLLSRAFINRGVHVHVYGRPAGKNNNYTHCTETKSLPKKPKLIIVLSEELPSTAIEWLSTHKTVRVIGLETNKFSCDRDNFHVLMVGTLTSQLYTSSPFLLGRTSFAQLCATVNQKRLDCAVCDITVPFSWLGDDAEKHLRAIFATSVIVSL